MPKYSDYRTTVILSVFKSGNYTAKSNEYIWMDTSGGAYTVTLPATPIVGANVRVGDSAQNAAVNNITIARNGNTINGMAENFVIDENNGVIDLIWNGTTWAINVPMFGTGGLTEAQVSSLADSRINLNAPIATGRLSLWTGNMANDEVWEYDFDSVQVFNGDVTVVGVSGTHRGIFAFRAADSNAFCNSIASTNISTSTNDLNVTPGTDGQVTISATNDRKFQINNRSGATQHFNVSINTEWIKP